MPIDTNMQILLVEDASVMRKMEIKVLTNLGLNNVEEAENGKAALKKLEEGLKPDLIISDWNMPEMDGYELLVAIRGNEAKKNIPFMMATGRGEMKEKTKAAEAGVSSFIAKPFNADELKAKIDEAMGEEQEEEEIDDTPKVNAEGKVKLKIGHIQITDHLVLGVLKHMINKGELQPKHFELETQCMSSWNPVAESLEKERIDGACVLAPIAMDLYAHGVPIKLVLFAHKNGSILVRNRDEDFNNNPSGFYRGKTFYLPHFMSIHHILAHMFFNGIGLSAGVPGAEDVDVTFEVVPPIKMPELLKENESAAGYLVAEPLGTKAIAAGIAQQQFLSSELWEEHPCCVVTMQQDFIDKYPDAVAEFTEMLTKAGKLIDQKPGIAAEIGVEFLDPDKKLGLKTAILKNVLTDPHGIKTNDLYPSIDELDRMQQYMYNDMGLGQIIDLHEFVDQRFAQRIYGSRRDDPTKKKLYQDTERARELLYRGIETVNEISQKEMLNKEGKYLLFDLSGQNFGIDIMSIREIIRLQTIRTIPMAPSYVLGVIQLRERVIPIIDIKDKLGLNGQQDKSKAVIIVLELDMGEKIIPMGIVVDAVSEVCDIKVAEMEQPPDFVLRDGEKYISAIVKKENKLNILLDINFIIEDQEAARIARIS